MGECRDACPRPTPTAPGRQPHTRFFSILLGCIIPVTCARRSPTAHAQHSRPLPPPSRTCHYPSIGCFCLTSDDHGRRLGGPSPLGISWRARPGRRPPPRLRPLLLLCMSPHHVHMRVREVSVPTELSREDSFRLTLTTTCRRTGF